MFFLPKVIGPIIDKNIDGRTGIINELISNYHVTDPIFSTIIIPQTSGTYGGSIKNIITWSDNYQSGPTKPWVQLTFPGRRFIPIGYVIKSPNRNICYAKEWKVEGFNEDEEYDSTKWTLLALHNTSQSNYCNGAGGTCGSNGVGHYSITPPPNCKGFKHIRWTNTKSACTISGEYFATSGIDLFGSLISDYSYQLQSHHSQIVSFKSFLFIAMFS